MKEARWKFVSIALGVMLVFSIGLNFSQPLQAEKQPHMHTALKSLQLAKAELKRSSHDKGGHRVKAIGLVKEAIDQVKKGVAFDNKNKKDNVKKKIKKKAN